VDYQYFYEYPNPNRGQLNFNLARQEHYDDCKDMIRQNPRVPQVLKMGKAVRQWRVHTCFEPCRRPGVTEPGFAKDERPVCSIDQAKATAASLLCLDPEKNENEIFTNENQVCLDSPTNSVCLDSGLIFLCIVIANTFQVIFETSLAYSIELTFRPTKLDKMIDNENFEDEQSQPNPD